jgi:mRNA-degrading endonuclease toxin of MazEF toxin-antitoxin module
LGTPQDERRPQLRYGQLIWASVLDRNGFAKERPCIVITPTDQIGEARSLLVMAVTTTFPDPPPKWHVPLPWNPNPRRVRTGLARRSAAVVQWVDVIPPEGVLQVRGEVPAKVMKQVESQLAEWVREQKGGRDG